MAVDPWGDDRDDMRAAVNTANLMAMQLASNGAESSGESMSETIESLRSYLKINAKEKPAVGPAMIRKLLGE